MTAEPLRSLRTLPLKTRYRSGEDELVEDFYVPCLDAATAYDRAVGYFNSSALALAARGLTRFIERGGCMRLVASPELSAADVEAMLEGYGRRQQILESALLRQLTDERLPDAAKDQIACLSWLIAHGRLDVRIAVLAQDVALGLYHEKLGIFRDSEDNVVAFEGSANESAGGLRRNFESVLAFRSWADGEGNIARQLTADFDRLWNRQTPALDVFDLPDAAKEHLLREYAPERAERLLRAAATGRTAPSPPKSFELRAYQRDAMREWFSAQSQGIFAMATGTGKTYTALACFARMHQALADQDASLPLVIVCPYQHLVQQWAASAREFGIDPVLAYVSREHWKPRLERELLELQAQSRSAVVVIVTNATFASPTFQEILGRFPTTSMLIADEMHNLGAPRLREALPEHFRFRLGLSATPERHHDSVGTAALERYFGGTVYELDIGRAIELGALCPYRYAVEIVELTGDELEIYHELTDKIGQLMASHGDAAEDPDSPLMHLLIKRARLLATARGKLPVLERRLRDLGHIDHALVYCGDGRVEEQDTGEELRQVEAAVKLLGRDLGLRVRSYTAETPVGERDDLRAEFADGHLDALVAIRCLDEGVDIPSTRTAFILASSTNPRQFIQRRGRVLRRAANKTEAEIIDFVVVPPMDTLDSIDVTERRLLARELRRVVEFAQLALNGPQVIDTLAEIRQRFDLMHIG